MPEEHRKNLTVKLKPDLLNRFNAVVKRRGLKNQFVVEQLVTEYLKKEEPQTANYDDGFYNEANIRWIKGSIAQMEQGKTVTKTIEELEKMAVE